MEILKYTTIVSVIFVTIAFLGSTPHSARGMYYVILLSVWYSIWKRSEVLRQALRRIPLWEFMIYFSLGLLMILFEETIAGISVNIGQSPNIPSLLASVPQYYANNLLLLPGFIIWWYLLLKRYAFTQKEVFILVGMFGIFAEKIYIHILNMPIMGISLILPTMFTYIIIILPSLLSLRSMSERSLHPILKYPLGFFFPIIISIPFLLIHSYMSSLWYIDPSILMQ